MNISKIARIKRGVFLRGHHERLHSFLARDLVRKETRIEAKRAGEYTVLVDANCCSIEDVWLVADMLADRRHLIEEALKHSGLLEGYAVGEVRRLLRAVELPSNVNAIIVGRDSDTKKYFAHPLPPQLSLLAHSCLDSLGEADVRALMGFDLHPWELKEAGPGDTVRLQGDLALRIIEQVPAEAIDTAASYYQAIEAYSLAFTGIVDYYRSRFSYWLSTLSGPGDTESMIREAAQKALWDALPNDQVQQTLGPLIQVTDVSAESPVRGVEKYRVELDVRLIILPTEDAESHQSTRGVVRLYNHLTSQVFIDHRPPKTRVSSIDDYLIADIYNEPPEDPLERVLTELEEYFQDPAIVYEGDTEEDRKALLGYTASGRLGEHRGIAGLLAPAQVITTVIDGRLVEIDITNIARRIARLYPAIGQPLIYDYYYSKTLKRWPLLHLSNTTQLLEARIYGRQGWTNKKIELAYGNHTIIAEGYQLNTPNTVTAKERARILNGALALIEAGELESREALCGELKDIAYLLSLKRGETQVIIHEEVKIIHNEHGKTEIKLPYPMYAVLTRLNTFNT